MTPILAQRAPRFIYVVGEVRNPGRFDLVGPTTAMQSIALAGGWNNGGNLRQIVVFRRAEDWRLLATRLDIRGALYGERPSPSDEIWLRDSDIVVVPKMPIRAARRRHRARLQPRRLPRDADQLQLSVRQRLDRNQRRPEPVVAGDLLVLASFLRAA